MKKRFSVVSLAWALSLLALVSDSEAAVGFIKVEAQPGLQMIANPLDHAVNNSVTNLFPDVPAGSLLIKFSAGKFTTNRFSGGAWSNRAEFLSPGEGAFFFNPTTNKLDLVFTGTVPGGTLTNSIPPGRSIKSSLLLHGRGLVTTDLGLKLAQFDNLLRWDGSKYVVFTALPGGGWHPREPQIAEGESFFIHSALGTNWVVTSPFP